jgi:mRNA interferase MazF
MREGDVALMALPQADGQTKPRPVLLLRKMPPFGDWLVCGISSQVQQEVAGFDEVISPGHGDFRGSGLKAASLIRIGFLAVVPPNQLLGMIGAISKTRHQLLLERLAEFLRKKG